MLKIIIICIIPVTTFSQSFYDRLNVYRVNNGLDTLVRDSILEKECELWLSKIKNIVHDPSTTHAEILVMNCHDDLWCWANSQTHNSILLSDRYKYIGYFKTGKRSCARLR